MKWIGQQTYDNAAADITGITAGTGLDGGGTSGNISLSVDVSDFLTSGANDRILTATSADAMRAEQYLTFANAVNVSQLNIISSENTSDYGLIKVGTNGEMTIENVDEDAANGHLNVIADGRLKFYTTGGTTHFYKGSNTEDYLTLTIGDNGDATFSTTDGAATAAHFEIAADGNITLDAEGDIALEAAGNDVTIDADTLMLTSSTGDYPQINLKNTTNDAQGAAILFDKLRADNDVSAGQNLGEIWFRGQDSAQNQEDYAYIIGEIDVGADGEESGRLALGVATHDGTNGRGLEIYGGSVANEVDIIIGKGTASMTTVSGDLSVTSGLILDSVDITTIQTSGESFVDNDTSLMTSASIDDKINTKYSTSYVVFSAKSSSSYGTNYIFVHQNGMSQVTYSVDSGVDSAGDFGGVTTEYGGSGTDATVDIPSASLENQFPIPEACKLMGFYATTSTTTNTGAGYDTGVAIWHVPEANVNWGGSVAGEATLIFKSDSSRHAENTAHGGTNRKKVQMVKRMDGTPFTLAEGDILVPSLFGETSNQQIMATITLVLATPIKTI